MGKSTKEVVSAKKIIEELGIPEHWREDAIREIWLAEKEGKDVKMWLKYKLEQWEIDLKEREEIKFVDPFLLDQRYLENNPGLHYDQYHGWAEDDI